MLPYVGLSVFQAPLLFPSGPLELRELRDWALVTEKTEWAGNQDQVVRGNLGWTDQEMSPPLYSLLRKAEVADFISLVNADVETADPHAVEDQGLLAM